MTRTAPVLLVTAATGGIGAATARAARDQGWRLVLLARTAAVTALAADLGGDPVARAVVDADHLDVRPTQPLWEAQVLRLARRMPELQIPNRPKRVAHYYDVSDDWIPIYDRTSLDGFYVAIGTSGNQFKNTPIIGHLMRAVIEGCEAGRDHDTNPIQVVLPRTGELIDMSHYSRRREVHAGSSLSVMG